MKAVVFRGIGDIGVEDVGEPRIEERTDAIVRLTASAICGTDLHFIRGTVPGVKPGTILGHEGVGIVEEAGPYVRNFRPGDRVVIPSTIGCGTCAYCRAGYYAQCDNANPGGSRAGTAFFGGPESAGGFPGLQAEYARVPYANVGLVKLPPEVSDEQAILMSDIFPTGYFGAKLAEVGKGDTVVVFGCGPVGQFAIASARLLGAGRVLAVDSRKDRLEMAQAQGAETVDFEKEDPVQTILEMTRGIGPDRAIDAVGVDAVHAHGGPGARHDAATEEKFRREVEAIAPEAKPKGTHWRPGDGPSQVLDWAVDSLAKAGTFSIIGVYPETATTFPIGKAMNRNLAINMGNCNHRKYLPELVDLVQRGTFDPAAILTQRAPILDAVSAYESFDERAPGWMKVKLEPQRAAAAE
jgi:threonine dehydrogenase-like Zn-dependent dehydrogenase